MWVVDIPSKDSMLVKVENAKGMTDNQLREEVLKMPNGGYAVKICRCGMYFPTPEGDCRTALIVDWCVDCGAPSDKVAQT